MKERVSEHINDSLCLTNCTHTYVDTKGVTKPGGEHGWWLYDETFGMNLAMRAETEKAALIEALLYYQKRFIQERTMHENLQLKVNSFLVQFPDKEVDE